MGQRLLPELLATDPQSGIHTLPGGRLAGFCSARVVAPSADWAELALWRLGWRGRRRRYVRKIGDGLKRIGLFGLFPGLGLRQNTAACKQQCSKQNADFHMPPSKANFEHAGMIGVHSRLSKDTGLASRQKAHEAKAAPFRLRLFSFVQHGSVFGGPCGGEGNLSPVPFAGTPTSHGLPPL